MPSFSGFPSSIVIATRASDLALWQARFVQSNLSSRHPEIVVELAPMTTLGDRQLATPLAEIGGKGLFVKELEEAMLAGTADLAVHSMKDVPMSLPPGFTLAAITAREDPRDALVCNRCASLAALPAGSRVGTASLRRASQLRASFPQLVVEPLRGNVLTRLRKLDAGSYAAIILAAAGLIRLGLESRISAYLSPEESLPAVGQGALGIECRAERRDLLSLLMPLNCEQTALCVRAERAMSRALAGSCQVPLGGYAEISGDRITLRGFVASPDGSALLRAQVFGDKTDPEAIGMALASELRTQGADRILAALEGR